MAIDFNSDLGKVRVLTGDTREFMPDGVTSAFIMSDEELTVIVDMNSSLLLAAATALEIMATKFATITQKIKTLDLQTDGPAVAKSLLDRAKALRDEYQVALENTGSDFDLFPVLLTQDYEWWKEHSIL